MSGDNTHSLSDVIQRTSVMLAFERVIIFKIGINQDCLPLKRLNFNDTLHESVRGAEYNQICLDSTAEDVKFYWLNHGSDEFDRVGFSHEGLFDDGHRLTVGEFTTDYSESYISLILSEKKCKARCANHESQITSPLSPLCEHCHSCVDCRFYTTGEDYSACPGQGIDYKYIYAVFIDTFTLVLAGFTVNVLKTISSSLSGTKYIHVRAILLFILLRTVLVVLYELVPQQVSSFVCLTVNFTDYEVFMAFIVDWAYKALYYSEILDQSTFERLWLRFNYCLPAILFAHSALSELNYCFSRNLNYYFYVQVSFMVLWLVYVCYRLRRSTFYGTLFVSLINTCVSSLGYIALSGGISMDARLSALGIGWVFVTKYYLEFSKDTQVNWYMKKISYHEIQLSSEANQHRY